MQILITGGAGFIGINSARYYLARGDQVTILDNFSRNGNLENIKWLKEVVSKKPIIVEADISKDLNVLKKAVKNTDLILHLAGQVAVTSSVVNPRVDFESNILGTFNLLEEVRLSKHKPVIIYSSTNKVYGALEGLRIKETKTRYEFLKLPSGVNELQPLDFHSPYGCSKGAADQYVRDYSRIYELNTIVFRQSCIYGPRQFGIEDQGWLAWFIIALTNYKKITIYGNGKQTRDILYIDDLIHAYDLAFKNIHKTKGQIYNIGGGTDNTISVWLELNPILEKLINKKINTEFADTRPGDQPIYISDIRKAKTDFMWEPGVNINEGIKFLYDWVSGINQFK